MKKKTELQQTRDNLAFVLRQHRKQHDDLLRRLRQHAAYWRHVLEQEETDCVLGGGMRNIYKASLREADSAVIVAEESYHRIHSDEIKVEK